MMMFMCFSTSPVAFFSDDVFFFLLPPLRSFDYIHLCDVAAVAGVLMQEMNLTLPIFFPPVNLDRQLVVEPNCENEIKEGPSSLYCPLHFPLSLFLFCLCKMTPTAALLLMH